MIKIVISGPECSGKTSLAHAFVKETAAILVPEVSRSILLLTGNQYHESELEIMALYQWNLEQTALALGRLTICDTSILEYKIWSEYRFGRLPEKVSELWNKEWASLWVLCEPIPEWIDDGLRVNERDRMELFELFLKSLQKKGEPFLILPAVSIEDRLDDVLHFLRDKKIYPTFDL